MGQRVVRVNELIKREISAILHTRYRSQSVSITITEVDVSPNLKAAKVFYSVLGAADQERDARRFFGREKKEIRRLIGQAVRLKYLPKLEFIADSSIERGMKINELMDDMGLVGDVELPEDETEDYFS